MRVGSRRMIVVAPISMAAVLIGFALAATGIRTSASSLGFRSHPFALRRNQTAQRKPLMADDVFKNVQVLKGVSVDDFMLTMGLISASLSFDCAECHPSAGTDQVDWAYDTPRKRTARKMMTMVIAINRDNFAGLQVVTCWTCHRGRDQPVVTPALDTVYGESNLEADDILSQASGVPSVDHIFDKYIQAIGGAPKLSTVTSFIARGKSVGFGGFGGDGQVEIFAQAPDKRATYIHFPDAPPDRGDSVRTYDGRAGWLATPLAVVRKYELTGSELDGARLDAQLSFPGQIKRVLTNLRVSDPTSIKDKEVQVVQGTGPRGMLTTLYFDKNSGLLLRAVRYGGSLIGRLPTQIDYSDYQDVGGIKFPFHSTFAWLDGRDDIQLSEVRLNVAIDAGKFSEPTPLPAPR